MPATLERLDPARQTERGKPAIAGSAAAALRIAAIWALVLFACVNLVLWKVAGEEKSVSKDLWSGSGSIDLAVAGFKALKQRPTVVLLGSSLMMFPFYAMDAETEKNPGDIFHHHTSAALTKALEKAGFKSPSVYSLAIFGQMSSDAYIYVDEFLKGDRKPDWLVFGIAPRDFSDHDLAAPTATFTFKRLVGLSNFGRYSSLYLPGWQEKGEFLFSHICYFYSKRWRMQQEFDKALKSVYKKAGLTMQESRSKETESNSGFMITGSAEERWSNSVNEYRRRYRDIGEKDLSLQMGFLSRLLLTCRERGIKVALINMPLTTDNRALLPPGFYDRFNTEVSSLAASNNARFIDLGESSEFTDSDYWDSTHLNHFGGHKLVDHLMTVVKP